MEDQKTDARPSGCGIGRRKLLQCEIDARRESLAYIRAVAQTIRTGRAGQYIQRFRREMTYDPLPALRVLRVPAMSLFGAGDRLIPFEKGVAVIRQS
jgi:hypothetical protein